MKIDYRVELGHRKRDLDETTDCYESAKSRLETINEQVRGDEQSRRDTKLSLKIKSDAID
jgi:hypothetical protein